MEKDKNGKWKKWKMEKEKWKKIVHVKTIKI
jgi:hypothetical protein